MGLRVGRMVGPAVKGALLGNPDGCLLVGDPVGPVGSLNGVRLGLGVGRIVGPGVIGSSVGDLVTSAGVGSKLDPSMGEMDGDAEVVMDGTTELSSVEGSILGALLGTSISNSCK